VCRGGTRSAKRLTGTATLQRDATALPFAEAGVLALPQGAEAGNASRGRHMTPAWDGSTVAWRLSRAAARASDDASFVNGSVYMVDGGAHAGKQVGLIGAD